MPHVNSDVPLLSMITLRLFEGRGAFEREAMAFGLCVVCKSLGPTLASQGWGTRKTNPEPQPRKPTQTPTQAPTPNPRAKSKPRTPPPQPQAPTSGPTGILNDRHEAFS